MSFWGLTVQKGPWKNTKQDTKRYNSRTRISKGGSIGEGGTLHAGHASWTSVVNPTAMSDYAHGTIPRPSSYSLKSIVTLANKNGYVRKPTLSYKPNLYQHDVLGEEYQQKPGMLDSQVPDQQDADYVMVNSDPGNLDLKKLLILP